MYIAKITAAAIALMLYGTGFAAASSHGNKFVMSAKLGGQVFIMYRDHMSLYTYDKDESGVSNCYDTCAAKWPPAILDADTDMPESYTLIERKDGKMQIAFKGRPLYLWSGDKKIGDIKGDGVGGVWRLARP
jgi:predicted lipoprotein with Yx(FWY)xxD motif